MTDTSEAIVEVRDYTIDPEWFEAYRQWATDHAAPWLRVNLDVIDFWVDDGHEPRLPDPIRRCRPTASRTCAGSSAGQAGRPASEGFRSTLGGAEWQEIWAKHPNPNAYLHPQRALHDGRLS